MLRNRKKPASSAKIMIAAVPRLNCGMTLIEKVGS